MRLIDADKLEIRMFGLNGDGVDEYDIENAPTVNAIVIPDNATNGDVIKAVFPNIEFTEFYRDYLGSDKHARFGSRREMDVDINWWNAPYEREGEVNET